VAEHTLDVGLVEAPSHAAALLTETCCEDELNVVVAPGHPLAGCKPVTPKQLVGQAYVSREPGSGTREFTDLYFRKAGIDPSVIGRDQRRRRCDFANSGLAVSSPRIRVRVPAFVRPELLHRSARIGSPSASRAPAKGNRSAASSVGAISGQLCSFYAQIPATTKRAPGFPWPIAGFKCFTRWRSR